MKETEKNELNVYTFNGCDIEFDSKNKNVMVNATEMAKVFGKRVDVFLKTDHVKEFINMLELTPNGVSSEPLKRDEIIKTRNGVNTFFHRILALKFAAWLDPKFELWVFSAIEHILFEDTKLREKSMLETIKFQDELAALEVKEDKTVEDFERYIELQWLIQASKNDRANLTKMKFRELRRNFNEPKS